MGVTAISAKRRLGWKNITALGWSAIIRMSLLNWPKNCFAVATQMVEHGHPGKPVYGWYHGFIAEDSVFSGCASNGCHHGWIEHDGRIFDPTRWVFEGLVPRGAYIYRTSADDDDYDKGSNRLREQFMHFRPVPVFDPNQQVISLQNLTSEIRGWIAGQLKMTASPTVISINQLQWLASLPLHFMSPDGGKPTYAKPIYSLCVELGRTALVPLDNYNEIMGETADGEIRGNRSGSRKAKPTRRRNDGRRVSRAGRK